MTMHNSEPNDILTTQDLEKISHGIWQRNHERDVLAPRRAAAAATAEREREAATTRAREYRAAAAAAEAWAEQAAWATAGDFPKPKLRPRTSDPCEPASAERLRRHAVDLAAAAPAIEIRWLRYCAPSQRMVGVTANAMALPAAGCVLVQPITDEWSYATVLHELGHIRGATDPVKIRRECKAWRWARSQALVWSPACQDNMTDALSTYVSAAERNSTNMLALLEVEELCSPMEYKRERMRRMQLAVAEEIAEDERRQRLFQESLKGCICSRCHAPATSMRYCDRCASVVAQESSDRALDRKIAAMRAEVDAMKWRRLGITT